jgi:ABC-2 type transport system permease protein
MRFFIGALQVEILKARRSRMPLFTALAMTLAPVMGGLFMFILKDPDRARRMGILGTKAQLTAGSADWPTFFGLLTQTIAVGGMLLFAIVTAWVFGREFADRNVRNLLALPTPRMAIVFAKLAVVAIWCGALSLWVLVLGAGIGATIALPGLTSSGAAEGVALFLLAAFLTIALQSTTALLASSGRGYLAPFGWALFTLFLAQILAATGWGMFFPWSVPALASGISGTAAGVLSPASIPIVVLTSIAGTAGVVLWWSKADQSG